MLSLTRVAMASIAASAIALGAAGTGVINAAPASAACASWSVPNFELVLNLVNGDTAFINIAQNEPDKVNVLRQPGGKQYLGEAEGGLNGDRVDVTVSWRAQFPDEDGNYGPRVNSHFTGYVGDDGFARGSALDNKGARVDWVSRDRFTCADKSPEPTPPPASSNSATVLAGGADVFNIAHNDVPDPATGIVGAKIATLAEGTQVALDGPCKTGWCRVTSPEIPQGYGFVEEGRLQIG